MVMCKYCDNTGKIEMDNNGPIVDCPVCVQFTKDERFWLRTYLNVYLGGLNTGMIRSTDEKRDADMIRHLLTKLRT